MLNYFPSENDFPNDSYRQEIWADITQLDVPNIIPNRYKISTWGRVYDSFNGNYYPTENAKCENFYPSVHFQFIDGTFKTMKIHLIMMKKFKPLDNDPSTCTDVDHLDGVRYHNWIWNLERVTHKENIQRCVRIGLYPVGENNPNSILTDNQARAICDMISKGYKVSEIIKFLKPYIPNISKHIVNDIKGKRNYRSISDEYDFSNMYYNKSSDNMLDESILREICECLEIDRDMRPKEIAIRIGYNLDNPNDISYKRFYQTVARMKNKTKYKNIWENYNY